MIPLDQPDQRHMFCPACYVASSESDWEYFDMPTDELECPECGEVVPVGRWIDGPVPQPAKHRAYCARARECWRCLKRAHLQSCHPAPIAFVVFQLADQQEHMQIGYALAGLFARRR